MGRAWGRERASAIQEGVECLKTLFLGKRRKRQMKQQRKKEKKERQPLKSRGASARASQIPALLVLRWSRDNNKRTDRRRVLEAN